MSGEVKLSEQQYQLMQVLWHRGEASAKTVMQALPEAKLAHTTVATILSRLEKRGVLSSRSEGREKLFSPLVSESDVKRSMVSSLVGTLFKGDNKALLAHLVKESDIQESELDDIRSMIEASEQDGDAS